MGQFGKYFPLCPEMTNDGLTLIIRYLQSQYLLILMRHYLLILMQQYLLILTQHYLLTDTSFYKWQPLRKN